MRQMDAVRLSEETGAAEEEVAFGTALTRLCVVTEQAGTKGERSGWREEKRSMKSSPEGF